MYRIQWHEAALDSLHDIAAYIGQYNPYAAARTVALIREVVNESIAYMPLMFPSVSGQPEYARVCPLPKPYLIFYDVDTQQSSVTIVKIIHAAQGSLR